MMPPITSGRRDRFSSSSGGAFGGVGGTLAGGGIGAPGATAVVGCAAESAAPSAIGVFRVRVGGHRSTGRRGEHLADERDPRGPTDEQDPCDVVLGQAGGPDRPSEALDGLVDPRADHLLELAAGDADLGVETGQQHREVGVGVARQRLLGAAGLVAQAVESGQDGVVGLVETVDTADRVDGLGEHRLVEVDPAKTFHAFGCADQLESGVGPPNQRRIERAATEVVHGDDVADVETVLLGVMGGSGFGLGEEDDVVDVGEPDGLAAGGRACSRRSWRDG